MAFQPDVMVWPGAGPKAGARRWGVARPVLVTVMVAVRPLFQALTEPAARHVPAPGGVLGGVLDGVLDGVLGPGPGLDGVLGPGPGLDGGVTGPNWVKNRHT